jgi:alkyldihydroxyacetonephosphate synthase
MPKENMVSIYEHIEDAARDEVFLAGGCISLHHGVGKIRKGFIDRTLPKMAIDWQKSIKDSIDPKNIFAINNTIPSSDKERERIAKHF